VSTQHKRSLYAFMAVAVVCIVLLGYSLRG